MSGMSFCVIITILFEFVSIYTLYTMIFKQVSFEIETFWILAKKQNVSLNLKDKKNVLNNKCLECPVKWHVKISDS